MGWLTNETEQFPRFTTNRRDNILAVSSSKHWHYVPTDLNPADVGTRPIEPQQLVKSMWLNGPPFLKQQFPIRALSDHLHDTRTKLVDKKQENESLALQTVVTPLPHTIATIQDWKQIIENTKLEQGIGSDKETTIWLIRNAQLKAYAKEREILLNQGRIKSGPLRDKDPFIDVKPGITKGVIRSGGRISRSPFLNRNQMKPIILPKGPDMDSFLQYLHAVEARHQGRYITYGMIRNQGYLPEGGRRRIQRLLSKCVSCRKLRGPMLEQKMADLPEDRLAEFPPFQKSGMDVFGPFKVRHGRTTRAASGTCKVWAIVFTCLYSRAVYLEVLENMDSAAFIMAFGRFQADCGKCTLIRCDAGTNFMGAKNEEEKLIQKAMIEGQRLWTQEGKEWVVNPPKASHFGGVWERAIGSMRKIIDATLLNLKDRLLSREEFRTLLKDAQAIINATPLWAPSDSPNDNPPLSPGTLWHLRVGSEEDSNTLPTEYDVMAYGVKRWKRNQALKRIFNEEWRNHYLYTLSDSRKKWKHEKRNVQVNDKVYIRDKNEHRIDWQIGVITHVKKSKDGLVRSATVKPYKALDGSGSQRPKDRPITDLVLLQSKEEMEEKDTPEITTHIITKENSDLSPFAETFVPSTTGNPTPVGPDLG